MGLYIGQVVPHVTQIYFGANIVEENYTYIISSYLSIYTFIHLV